MKSFLGNFYRHLAIFSGHTEFYLDGHLFILNRINQYPRNAIFSSQMTFGSYYILIRFIPCQWPIIDSIYWLGAIWVTSWISNLWIKWVEFVAVVVVVSLSPNPPSTPSIWVRSPVTSKSLFGQKTKEAGVCHLQKSTSSLKAVIIFNPKDIHSVMELVSRRRCRPASAQVISCCVYEMLKQ